MTSCSLLPSPRLSTLPTNEWLRKEEGRAACNAHCSSSGR